MTFMIIIAALAVYKTLQVILALLPREVMPWVKVVAGTILSFVAVGMSGSHAFREASSFGNFVLFSLATATLAGVTHSAIRLVTYLGDYAARRSLK